MPYSKASDDLDIAPGVACLPLGIVNAYFLEQPGAAWLLVDTGMAGSAGAIRAAAEARYGRGTRPQAIILTHGHFDHAGNARALADAWNVPIYVHPLETPYLTGQSKYPPFDPTVGGFVPSLSHVFPSGSPNLEGRLQALPADGSLPGLSGWQWHHTPGHSPGHVSLLRPSDGTLIAGDALSTMNMDSFRDTVTKKREMALPPTFATCDWPAARASVEALAALHPTTIAAGHGRPMTGKGVGEQLETFAQNFTPPTRGRYVPASAVTDERGVVSVPPPAPDRTVGLLALGLTVLGAWLIISGARRSSPDDPPKP